MFNRRLYRLEKKKISKYVSKAVENVQAKGHRETMADMYL